MDTRLRNIEFNLLYLGLLTKKKVKPLSRWERKLGPTEIETLKSMGLRIRSIKRYLESGQIFEELIFSENEELMDVYANAFMEKPINNSSKTALLEGKLFGYPECCVRSFASRGYLPNGFNRDDQRILFHWACPNCHVTPQLLPQYRNAYEEARLIQRGYPLKKLKNRQVARIIPLVGLASCILVIGCEHKSVSPSGKPDIHWISVENDSDNDYLKDEWEKHLGLDPSNPDTDGNSVLDGVQLAKKLCSQIQNPPEWIRIDDNKMFGLYVCSKCGQAVNMGFMEITNTQKGTSICVDYLALHYMEHGSLAYEGKEGISGLVDAIKLDSILSDIPSGKPDIHWISVENDSDNDYLKDEWEKHLGLDPSKADTDVDGVLDGVQLAKRLWSQIQNPPEWIRIDDYLMDGLYVCSKCGQAVDMGFMEITNTRKGTSICVDYLALHYMEHGSLAYEGKEGISGLVDAVQLDSILSNIPPGKPDIHWISVENDSDNDYLKDEWEKHFGLDPSKADTDGDSILDGVQLAKRLWSQIQNPPEWIKIDDHWFKGLYTCSKCGETVNMGYIEITNTSKNASIMVDYLALHYLEHGSLAYEGKEEISGIVDPIQLDSILSK